MIQEEKSSGAATTTVGGARIEPALSVQGISKSFGQVTAVRDLSFEANSGQVIGLLGPNGAGKTTSVRVLSTILAPTDGRFAVCGIPHTRPAEIRQIVGVLPESAGYPHHLTGDEFLRYHARLFGHSGPTARRIAADLLSEVGLAERASSLISAYSRGMRQRLGVARALVNAPKVIFLDEPTLGLDPAGQRQILALIRDVASERGAAIILSTHFLDEVEETCSRVIILNRGSVIASGTVSEIKRIAAPRTALVQVAPEMREAALSALKATVGVASVERNGAGMGRLAISFDSAWIEAHRETGMNSAVRALTDADVPILAFELEGGRLSDAFLLLTEEDGK